MELGSWVTIGVFFVTQVLSFIWTVSTLRSDMSVMRSQMDGVQRELEKQSRIIEEQATLRTDIVLMQERSIATAGRMNNLEERLTRLVERHLPNNLPNLPRVDQ